MKQIFIFSLPRSGSTLLQRSLMSHPKIASVSEPWVLLPQIYALRSNGHLSEYGGLPASRAINDLIELLPDKKKDYYNSLRKFIDDIQRKLSKGEEEYFLDKTPRYYFIIDEIAEIFPNAKFIFLFRSPEQIYSSMLKTWGNNRFGSFLSSHNDLIYGNMMLSEAYEKFKNRSAMLNYESLVTDPEKSLSSVCEYLELSFTQDMINKFSSQETKGRLGDPTGIKKYDSISEESLHRWKNTFNTPLRKLLARRTINKIDEKALSIQGYEKDKILKEIRKIRSKPSLRDFRDGFDYFKDSMVRKFNLQTYFSKDFNWSRKKYLS